MRSFALCALTTLAVIAVACDASAAASFNKRLDRANALLKTGDVKGALTEYRDLQTDDPESPVLYYNIGRAQYQSGMQNIDLKANQDALDSFKQAQASFEKVLNTADPEIRKEAAFNHANSVAQVAMQSSATQSAAAQSAAPQNYQETIDAFKQSVAEYETFLRQFPDHTGARENLDHMRYLLKTMMQNPPPPQQDQQQQKGKDDKSDDKKDDKSKDQKKDDKQQGQEQDKKDEQKSEEQKQAEQKKEEQKKEAEQKKAEQQNAQEAEKKEDQKDQQQQADNQKPDDKQNTDAILQSLEDIDKREQKETRNEHGNVKIKSNWW